MKLPTLTSILAMAVFLPFVSTQAAVTLAGVSATYGPADTIATPLASVSNGSGLVKVDPDNVETWTHSTNYADTWQAGGASSNATNWGNVGWVLFDLGSVKTDLSRMYAWNISEGSNVQTQRGIQTFKIWYSSSAIATPVAAADYNFSAAGWTQLGLINTLGQALGTNVPHTHDGSFDLSGISGARYIGLELITNYGSGTGGTDTVNRYGLAEVIFTVPEPGKGLYILSAVAVMFLRRRR